MLNYLRYPTIKDPFGKVIGTPYLEIPTSGAKRNSLQLELAISDIFRRHVACAKAG